MNKLKQTLVLGLTSFFLTISFHTYATSEVKEKNYAYTRDWTTGHSANWAVFLEDFKGKPNIKYLEVGLFEGRSMIWMLQNILTHPKSKAIGIDLFDDIPLKKRYFSNMKLSGLSKKVKTLIGPSQKKLRELPLNHFDVLYIDGSHAGPDILSDAVQGWELVKVGGIIIFDDYMLIPEDPQEIKPQIAIDSFMSVYKNKFVVLHKDWQYAIKKTAP